VGGKVTFADVNIVEEEGVLVDTKCAHCGDSCADALYEAKGEVFCCMGCQTVYTLLLDNGMDSFYSIDSSAGLSQKDRKTNAYDYLDDPTVREKLVFYEGDNRIRVWLSLPTIHCSSCLWLLENLSRINSGVIHSTVNYLDKKATFLIDTDRLSLRDLVVLLDQIGYPPHLSFQDTAGEEVHFDRSIYYKLGIAGFVFGNIMLLSFPEYFGLTAVDDLLSDYIRYINLVLILPVILYCAQDYFISSWSGLKHRHLSIDVPIVIGMLALFTQSLVDIFLNNGPGYLDSLAGLIFFLLIGKWFQKITYRRIRFDLDFRSYFPIAATVLSSGIEESRALDKIIKGDKLKVRFGELIPADGYQQSDHGSIDYSFVTGETSPVEMFQYGKVYAGGKVVSDFILMEVEKTVSTSYLTQLWNDASFKEGKVDGATSKLNAAVAKYFTVLILLVAVVAFSFHVRYDVALATEVFCSVLIIACPCAVALAIPFTFGNIVRLLALKKVFFKNTNVIERCAQLNTIVFDKTGTITESRLSNVHYLGTPLDEKMTIGIVAVCSHSSHPVSKLIIEYLGGTNMVEVEDFKEKVGLGVKGILNEQLIQIGSKNFYQVGAIKSFIAKYPLAENANVFIKIEEEIIGAMIIQSEFIPELSSTLELLSSKFALSLISGDNNNDERELIKLFNRWKALLFGKTPFEKLEFIKSLQKNNQSVAMIGDGLNDAGALSRSDVGIAISKNTTNFTPASDIVMDAEMFSKLPIILNVCRKAMVLIMVSYALAFCYNIIGLSFAVQGLLSPVVAAILMPLSSITIVLFGFISSTILVRFYRL